MLDSTKPMMLDSAKSMIIQVSAAVIILSVIFLILRHVFKIRNNIVKGALTLIIAEILLFLYNYNHYSNMRFSPEPISFALNSIIIYNVMFIIIGLLPLVLFFSPYYVLKRFFGIGRVKNAAASLIIALLLISLPIIGLASYFGVHLPLVFPWSTWRECLPPSYVECVDSYGGRTEGCGSLAITPMYCMIIQISEYVIIFAAALVIVVPPAIEKIKKFREKS